jgi:zinc protease
MPSSTLASGDLKLLETFWREPIHRSILPNGLTLIVKPDHSAALASVQVWVKTGSMHEGANLGAGLSHYLEHMLFKGTARRAGREISATVQAHGGYINAYTTFDRTVYYIDLPSENAEVAIDLLADAVLHSTLPADEATKEKDVILREIAMTQDDPDDRLWESLFSTSFREHPYGLPVIGHREIFAGSTHADLTAYYRARYVPNNLVVVIVGEVDLAAMQAAVAARFGTAPRARLAPVLVPAEPAQLGPREQHAFRDVETSRAILGWQVPGLTHPEAPVLDLLAMVLGHGDSSILWQEVREKAALVHSIDAACWNPGASGLFCVSFTADANRRLPATAAVERVLDRCAREGFSLGQLQKSLRQLVVGEIAARQTISGQASRLGAAEVVAGDLGFSRAYFERLRSVRPADLQRVLRAYLIASKRTSVSLNPSASAPGPEARTGESARRPDFTEVRLANGARLLLQPDRRLPQVHFRVLLQGGPKQEAPGKRGATALLATLLTKDTRGRSAAEVARYIESVGGSFYPFSGNNCFGIAAEVLPPDVPRALSVLAGALFAPAFRAAAFGVERDAQLASLLQEADDVVTHSRKLLRQKFFGAHPLALDAHGDEAGLAALTPADLAALHRRLCVGGNVVLAVTGDFDPRRLAPSLKALLARLSRGAAPASPDVPARRLPAAVGEWTERRAREQAVVLQGYPAPPLLDPDYFVGEVADELFSGMASRLFERVREEKGLAYFVRSSRVSGLDAAMFSFFAGTQPGKETEVLAEIDAEIARVQSGGVEEAELQRCQARLKAARRQGLQSNSSRAFHAGLGAVLGLPANDWKHYDTRIAAVTRGDLAKFAETYLQRNRRTQLIVTP